jgi:uncharacterized protein YpmB
MSEQGNETPQGQAPVQPTAQPPQPQQPQQPAGKPKKPIYKRVWFWIVVVIIVCIIASAASGGGSSSSSSSSSGSNASTSAEQAEDSSAYKARTLYNKGGIKVVVTGRNDDIFNPGYTIKITNKSKNTINVSLEDLSIGGKMYDNWFYETVSPKKTAEADLTPTESISEDELKDVECKMTISYDEENLYETIAKKTVKIDD